MCGHLNHRIHWSRQKLTNWQRNVSNKQSNAFRVIRSTNWYVKKKKWNSQCGVATHWRHHSQRRQCVCDIFAISKIDLFFSSSLLFLHRLCVSAIVNLNFSFRFALSIRRHFEVVVRCCKIKIEFWVAIFTRYFSCFYSVSVRSALLFPTCVRYQIR